MRSFFVAEPSDKELLGFVECWIDLLAAGDFEAAFQFTEHDPYYAWTPQLIQAVLAGYGLPEPCRDGRVFRVTARHEADGMPSDRLVERGVLRPGVLAEVAYSLPLNGEWSDLTATFALVPTASRFSVVLHEIHVF